MTPASGCGRGALYTGRGHPCSASPDPRHDAAMHPANAITLFRTTSVDDSVGRRLQRQRRDGSMVRVRHGVYVERSAWEALDGISRHLVLVRATVPDLPVGAVLSHESAAAVHGLPRLDAWPLRVHAVVPGAVEDVHRVGLTLHAGSAVPDGRRFHGVEFTSLSGTAVEIARRADLSGAVVTFDEVLRRGVSLDELLDAVGRAPRWGTARAAEALEVSSADHESVGESYLAARFHELGIVGLVPQQEFVRSDGGVDRVDFWLPALGMVVEFDGRAKYEDPAMTGGRSGADVVWAEKVREDRVRARPEVRGVVRVTWWHLVESDRLRSLLRTHGVPCR